MIRNALLGAASGLVASLLLPGALGLGAALTVGVAVGIAWPFLFQRSTPALADATMAGATLGFPLWAFVAVALLPLLHGEEPRWTPEGMRALLPALVALVLFGAVLGAVAHGLSRAAERLLGPVPVPRPAP